jgi:ribosomal protein L29
MASKEIKQLRKKTEIELKGSLGNLRGKLKQLRFDLAAGKVKNVREIRKIKKEIARILMLLKEAAGKKNK